MKSIGDHFSLGVNNKSPSAPFVGPIFTEVDAKIEKNEFLTDVDQSPFLVSALFGIKNEKIQKSIFANYDAFKASYEAPEADSAFSKVVALAKNHDDNTSRSLLYNIVHASKKKRLDADNISSYFAGKGVIGFKCNLIAKFVSAVRSRGLYDLIKQILVDGEAFDTSVWSQYHNSLFSAVNLFNDHGDNMVKCGLIKKAELDTILDKNHYDEKEIKTISGNHLAKMQVYLTVTGNDDIADKWYQGKLAVRKFPPGVAATLRKLIKAYYKFEYDPTGKTQEQIKTEIEKY